MPTYSFHVPEEWPFAGQFRAVLAEHHRGKVSPYLLNLVERDLRGLGLGTPQSAFSLDDVKRGRAAELALLRAELLARELLFSEGTARVEAGRRLANHLLNATRIPIYPEPGDDAALAVAEADALAAGEQARREAAGENPPGRRVRADSRRAKQSR